MATARSAASITTPGAPAGDVGDTPSHISMWSAQSGGTPLGMDTLTKEGGGNFTALTLGQTLTFDAGDIELQQDPVDGETAAMAVRALQGKVSANGIWFQIHDGAPGSNQTANVLNMARFQLTFANTTFAE